MSIKDFQKVRLINLIEDILILFIIFYLSITYCKGATTMVMYPINETLKDTYITIDNKGTVDMVIKTQDFIFSTNYGYCIQLYGKSKDDEVMFIPTTTDTLMIMEN